MMWRIIILCNQGECYPPRPKIKVDNSLPYRIILCIIQKLNSIIIFVLVFIQNVSTFLTTLHPYGLFSKHLSVSHMVSGFNQILLSCRYSSKSYDIYQAFFGGIFLHFFHLVLVRNLANLSLKSCELFVCSQLCINNQAAVSLPGNKVVTI